MQLVSKSLNIYSNLSADSSNGKLINSLLLILAS